MWQHWQTPYLIQQIVHINTMCHLQRLPGCWLPGLCQQGKDSIPAKLTGRKIKGKDSGKIWHRTAANPETWVHPCRKGKMLREIISKHNYPAMSRLWAHQRRGYTLLSPSIREIPTWTLLQYKFQTCSVSSFSCLAAWFLGKELLALETELQSFS